MPLRDVVNTTDIEKIVARFYETMLKDPIVGFIFTDVANIDLDHHLPIIVNFWADSLFKGRRYTGNPLQAHLNIHQQLPLKAGHFTRWLYLFNQAIDELYAGENAEKMKQRAEMVAQSIAAAITDQKRNTMNLTLPKATEIKL